MIKAPSSSVNLLVSSEDCAGFVAYLFHADFYLVALYQLVLETFV